LHLLGGGAGAGTAELIDMAEKKPKLAAVQAAVKAFNMQLDLPDEGEPLHVMLTHVLG